MSAQQNSRITIASVSLIFLLGGVLRAAEPAATVQPKQYLTESYRRQDWTGRGTFHRIGMLGENENTLSLAADANLQDQAQTPDAKAATEQAASTPINKIFSFQVNARSMFFGSDNIFNTENFAVSGSQYAQFLGVGLNAQFNEHWRLATTFDQAWFFFLKQSQSSGDFLTSTVRQALSYDHFIFNNKASISIPVSWQYSGLFNRQSGNRTLDTWQYGTGLEFSWFAKDWVIPTFSYVYSYQNADGPGDPADKHKNDFNLGMTFIPIKGAKLYVIPSVQYSHESFFGTTGDGRRDDAWTPTLTASWQPLKWLALDLVGSYTDSRSNATGSSFKALTGTAFLRIFYSW